SVRPSDGVRVWRKRPYAALHHDGTRGLRRGQAERAAAGGPAFRGRTGRRGRPRHPAWRLTGRPPAPAAGPMSPDGPHVPFCRGATATYVAAYRVPAGPTVRAILRLDFPGVHSVHAPWLPGRTPNRCEGFAKSRGW